MLSAGFLLYNIPGDISKPRHTQALAVVTVEDADGVDLLHLVVLVAYIVTLRDCPASAVIYSIQVMELAGELHLDDDQVALAVLGLDVDAVEPVGVRLLVRLALEQLHDVDLLVEEHGDEALEDAEIGLVAEDMLYGPVKPDISVVLLHIFEEFLQI